MKARPLWPVRIFALCAALSASALTFGDALAQDGKRESVDIFLEDEQLDVEADIPSVELVLTYKGLRYESIELKASFLPELYETVERDPF